MKLPCRILGLIAAAAAAPVVIGCASEPSEPTPNKTDQNIQTERSSDEEEPKAERDPSESQTPSPPPSAESLPAVPPDQVDAPRTEGELPPEEELPHQAEDMPLKGVSPIGGPASAPLEGAAPHGGSAMPGQDPCPACGMG